MEDVVEFLVAVDAVEYDGKPSCVEIMDALLQDLIKRLTKEGYRTSGDLLELKNCSWVCMNAILWVMRTSSNGHSTIPNTVSLEVVSILLIPQWQEKGWR